MTTQEITGLALAGLGWAWKHVRAVAAEATSYAEKQNVLADGKLSNEELEAIAVHVIRQRTGLPAFVAAALVRWVCGWRKRVRIKVTT